MLRGVIVGSALIALVAVGVAAIAPEAGEAAVGVAFVVVGLYVSLLVSRRREPTPPREATAAAVAGEVQRLAREAAREAAHLEDAVSARVEEARRQERVARQREHESLTTR
jgi:apolipoprotein N-acyltransferase